MILWLEIIKEIVDLLDRFSFIFVFYLGFKLGKTDDARKLYRIFKRELNKEKKMSEK